MAVPLEPKLKKYLKNIEIMKTPSCLDIGTIGFYIEKKLPKEEKMRVEKHISSCLYCLNQLTELKELVYFQRQSAPVPSYLLQRIKDLFPKEEKHRRELSKDIFSPVIQRISNFLTFPVRQWRYATVSIATALVIISIFIVYKGFSPEKPFDIKKITEPRGFTMLSLKEVKNPIIIESENIDNTFEQVRKLIQAQNGKMVEAVWIEKGIKLTFTLRKEEETSLFDDFSKLGEVIAKGEGYRDKKGNIVVLLKER